MKHTAIIILLFLTLNACANHDNDNGDEEKSQFDHSYSIENPGFDFYIKEFTPKSNPNYTCVYVRGHKSLGLQCFPKPESNYETKRSKINNNHD